MPLSQNDMGRAFEYGVAVAMSQRLPGPLITNPQLETAQVCFTNCSEREQEKIFRAATEVAAFLCAHDENLTDSGYTVGIQADQLGMRGDVRDIILSNPTLEQEIGISAKNRHVAVKHSRLSEHIDFGAEWFSEPCSPEYFHTVTPIFRELYSRQRRGELWRDIPDKKQRYYLPVLQAFQKELNALFQANPQKVANGLIRYLLGRIDFYKVIKENGTVSILSFNLNGSLGWGNRLPLPADIIQIAPKPRSETTIFMVFDRGWSISFRIHNASERVEPSLKFDIAPIGFPSQMSRHVIRYG